MGVLRAVLAWLLVAILCVAGLVVYIAKPFNPNNNCWLGRVLARSGRWVLGMERRLVGFENMPQDRPTVVIANHQHNEDLFIMADLLPPRGVAVGKSALAWVPFFGQVFWLGGNILINRAKSRRAVAVMQTISAAITSERKSIWVFPEGTRSHGRGLQPFKKGAFYAAIAAEAPITMVCASSYSSKTGGLLGRRHPVTVQILPPIETAGLTNADISGLVECCQNQMQQVINTLPAAE